MQQVEARTLGIDFVNYMQQGETLQSATWSCIVIFGVDPAPASHLFGPAQLVTPDGSTQQTATKQGFGGFLPGVTYALLATVMSSLGNTHALFSHIRGIEVS